MSFTEINFKSDKQTYLFSGETKVTKEQNWVLRQEAASKSKITIIRREADAFAFLPSVELDITGKQCIKSEKNVLTVDTSATCAATAIVHVDGDVFKGDTFNSIIKQNVTLKDIATQYVLVKSHIVDLSADLLIKAVPDCVDSSKLGLVKCEKIKYDAGVLNYPANNFEVLGFTIPTETTSNLVELKERTVAPKVTDRATFGVSAGMDTAEFQLSKKVADKVNVGLVNIVDGNFTFTKTCKINEVVDTDCTEFKTLFEIHNGDKRLAYKSGANKFDIMAYLDDSLFLFGDNLVVSNPANMTITADKDLFTVSVPQGLSFLIWALIGGAVVLGVVIAVGLGFYLKRKYN